jgi:uroporphyrin-III C-methyltransferase
MSRLTARQPRKSGLVALSGGEAPARVEGAVWLVGAGPGDPELLTIKALRLLQAAQVVVHDGLVSDEILSLIPADVQRINVAKHKSRHTLPQTEINRLLVALALDGRTVVRLKGGDPFVFGRGGEELLACRAAGVACHVVPGVTAALAACAGAGAPLTHRGLAQSATVITGHGAAGEQPDLDWPALARPNHTVAIYMGLSAAVGVSQRLIAAGRDRATPALIVVNASRTDEQRIATTLVGLPAAAEGLNGPAVLIIGEAMALADVSVTPVLEAAIKEAAQ